jgi:hypothetical protein
MTQPQPPFLEQPGKLQMQSPLHTPGPWRSHGAGGEIHGNSRVVATMCWCSGMHDEDEANARLIAAAPDMLAALNAIRVWMKNHDRSEHEQKIYDAIRVVIARAEGQ